MNNKTKTPFITVILYLAGIVLLAVSAYMLYAAIMYTKTYLASYGATFTDMLPNSLQYIIQAFVPYCALALISFGAGKAAKGGVAFKKNKPGNWDDSWDEVFPVETLKKEIGAVSEELSKLSTDLEEIKVTGAIKLEEMERRQAYRIEDSRNQIKDTLGEMPIPGWAISNDEDEEEGFDPRLKRPRHFIK